MSEKLSITEKVGYSLGDLAANLIFQTLIAFLAFFYTDVYQLSPGVAASIIFTGGMVGAFFNPIMGMIADRTRTRWGKFRPWILWTAVPFGLIALAAFKTPDVSPQAKIAYAFTTYILLVLVYSANNLPYSALSGVMTGSMAQRNSLSSYRFVAVLVAQFIIQVLMLPLVLILGDGDKAKGFEVVMTAFAVLGVVCFLITFVTTRERVVVSDEHTGSVMQDLRDLLGNRPWIMMLFVTVLVFIALALKGGAYIYYFQHYLDPQQIQLFLSNSGLNSGIDGLNQWLDALGLTGFNWPSDPVTSGFSLFNAGGIIMMILGIAFSKPLADRFGKRDTFGVGLFAATLFVLGFYWLSPTDVALVFVAQMLHGFFYGITIPLLWAMIADVADYSEWKNCRRATAMIFSAMIFGLKIGLSLGGALIAAILAHYQYDAALSSQSEVTKEGIRLTLSVYSGLPFLLAVGCLFGYHINKHTEQQIELNLSQRRTSQ